MTTEAIQDAALFAALHRALREQCREQAEEPANRRGATRMEYQCVQLLAPYDGVTLPLQAAYAPVLLKDLSPQGFCYLTDQPPRWGQLVVALGRTPFKFFLAETVNQSEFWQAGRGMIQVGCRFVSRIT